MALAPRLDLRQSQSLVMTPQLQQAIRLLALSNLELEAAIAEEMANNPLLADAGEGSEAPAPVTSDAAESTDRLLEAGVSAAGDTLDVDLAADTFHHDSGSDALWEGVGSGGGDGEGFDFDSIGSGSLSLRDHLIAQAGEVLGGPALAIAAALIESIDEAGYCDADLSELAMRLGVPRVRVEDVLHVIQTFDPTGVGARDLAECLALQAKEADRYDPCMAKLIDNLDLLARGQVQQLKRMCDVDDEDMADMIRELRGYDPKPGLRFARDDATPVVPDVFVRRTVAGWSVEINSATLPRLLVDRRYYAELSAGAGKGAGKAWLQERLASANWLIKALDQRQQTIIKVTQEIVKQQEGYFLYGVGALRPLTLRQVADAIGMHESTVSRVTSNKYVHSPRGLNELKYFFSSGVMAADGEGGMSAEAVKSRIRALIEAEDPKAILSDDTLVDMLGKEGCEIARRTVAKYREAMGIGSSVQRRRAKAIGM
jgi:RNA polymerase sigma-54 factor